MEYFLSRFAFIFIIFAILVGGLINEILSCQMQKFIRENKYFRHVLAILIIFVFIMLEGGWSLNPGYDKLGDGIVDWSSGNIIDTLLIAIGGFDERFTRAQDWELNFRLRENGGIVYFDPRLHVTYRPRSSVKALAKQYFEYGRWRRAVARQHKGTTNFRYLAPPLNLVLQSLSVLLGLILSPIFFIPTIGYLLAIFLASIALGKSVGERFTLPIVLIVMHFSWGFGFISSPRNLISK